MKNIDITPLKIQKNIQTLKDGSYAITSCVAELYENITKMNNDERYNGQQPVFLHMKLPLDDKTANTLDDFIKIGLPLEEIKKEYCSQSALGGIASTSTVGASNFTGGTPRKRKLDTSSQEGECNKMARQGEEEISRQGEGDMDISM